MKNITLTTKVVKSTEKAILIEGFASTSTGGVRQINLWLPKSQVTVADDNITVPAWLLSAKMQDNHVGTYLTIGSKSYCKLDLF